MKREIETFLNATHDAMIAIDNDEIITIFNKAAEKLTQINSEDAIGKNVAEVIETTRLPLVLKTGDSELNRKQPLGEIEIVTNRMPVYDEDGEIIGAIAVFRDITEIKELAEKITDLKEIKIMLEAIFESTQDAISVVDQNGYGVLINPAYTRLTGYTEKDVIGKFCTVDLAEGESVHLKVLETREPVSGVKLKVGPKRREVIVEAAPIIVDGELRGSVAVIHDLTEINELINELDEAKSIIRSLEAKYTFEDIIGQNKSFLQVIEKAKAAATTPATIILRGESGTGKELFAHAIHNKSKRRYSQFVRVNCAAISESLLESELFGYEAGAFTGAKDQGKVGLFERANGGTIFLDEIGEINKRTQVKLLRVLQEKEIVRVGGTKAIPVDVRVISATNMDLEKAVENNEFRKDLYYRLNVVPINIPPLREHIDDLKAIVDSLITKYNQEYGRNVSQVSNDALYLMKNYSWPGNVRELENFIGRAIINMELGEQMIKIEHLPKIDSLNIKNGDLEALELTPQEDLKTAVENYEREYIKEILKANNNNREKTAQALDISLRSLYYKLKKYNIN
jgi:PAS domain S-box-containing protein